MEPFEKIYELYFKDVYHYILSLCKNGSEAEEITQETFFRAMKSMDSFRGDCKMIVWLCQIAKHLYFSRQKAGKRQETLTPEVENTPGNAGNVETAGLEQRLADEADAMEIHQALHCLSEPYKEVFMLRVFGELPFLKIARIFGKTESWARVTYHRAKLKLIEEMEDKYGKDFM